MSWAARIPTLEQRRSVDPRQYVMMGGRMANQAAPVTGADRGQVTFLTRTSSKGVKYVQLVFQGAGLNNDGSGEFSTGGDVWVSAGLERVSASPQTVAVTFGGQLEGRLSPYGELISDPILYSSFVALATQFPINTFFCFRVQQRAASIGAGLYSCQRGASTTSSPARSEQNLFFAGAPANDNLYSTGAMDATGAVSGGGRTGLVPAAIIGEYIDGTVGPAVYWGPADSIQDRYAGVSTFNMLNNTGGVAIEQALSASAWRIPYCKASLASSSFNDWIGPGGNACQKRLMRFATAVFIAAGRNDLAQTRTAAFCYGVEQEVWRYAKSVGVYDCWSLPVLPSGTTSDTLLTAANQSISAAFGSGGERDILNALKAAGVGAPDGPTRYLSDYTAQIEDVGDHTKARTDGATAWLSYVSNDAPSFIHPSTAYQAGGLKTAITDQLGTLSNIKRAA